uniref:Uncharacterized protein n=1 Tax=Palpitomonas bilix TaxID=652834 RepID=A0A7S3DB77_9EUKA
MAVHKKRRALIKSELSSLISLFKDSPGLLGPKTEAVLALGSFANYEVMWSVSHHVHLLSKDAAKKASVQHPLVDDSDVIDLIGLVGEVIHLLRTYRDTVAFYHASFIADLSSEDLISRLREYASRVVTPNLADAYDSMVNTLKLCKEEFGDISLQVTSTERWSLSSSLPSG